MTRVEEHMLAEKAKGATEATQMRDDIILARKNSSGDFVSDGEWEHLENFADSIVALENTTREEINDEC